MSHHVESLSLADDASVFNELPNINLRTPDPARINNSHLDDSDPSFLASVSHNLILGPSEIGKLSLAVASLASNVGYRFTGALCLYF